MSFVLSALRYLIAASFISLIPMTIVYITYMVMGDEESKTGQIITSVEVALVTTLVVSGLAYLVVCTIEALRRVVM